MSRYIDADKLQEAFKELHGGKRSLLIDTEPTADVVEADKAQKEIDYWHDKAQSYEQTILKLSLNKADAVDVVRCEDCNHNYRRTTWNHGERDNPSCKYTNYVRDNDFYCGFGERAEE